MIPRSTLLLCAVATALTAVLFWQQRDVPGRPLAVQPAAGPLPVAAPAQPAPRALAELTDTVARPLFEAGRRPAPEPAPAGQPDGSGDGGESEAAQEKLPVLTGVVIDGGDRMALMRVRGEEAVYRVRAGERVGQWRVHEISPHGAVLARGERREEVALRIFDSPPPRRRPAPRLRQAAAGTEREERGDGARLTMAEMLRQVEARQR